MTQSETRLITAHRLDQWAGKLADDMATPAILIAVGHGKHSGDITMCVPHDSADELIRELLRVALEAMGG